MLCLLLGERIPVAVVVVADVVVVEPRQGGSLVLGAEPLVVPVHHPLRPVGIQGRNVQQDDVVQNLADSLLVRRRQPVQESRGGLRPTHLGRVDTVRDEHHGAPCSKEFLELLLAGHPARIREPHLDVVKLAETTLVLLARDGHHHEWQAHGREAERIDLHSLARVCEHLVVRR